MFRKNEKSPFKGGRLLLKAVALGVVGSMLVGGTFAAQAAGLKDVFDAQLYSDTYQDLQAAFGTDSTKLYNHYIEYGLSENRIMTELIDVKKYRERYPDLDAAFGDDWDAYVEHFITYGFKEGRESFGTFDVRAYAERYPDLQAAFGDDVLALYQHWLNYGKSEGRNGSAFVIDNGSDDANTAPSVSEQSVTVTGTLLDPETGAPIPNAVIRVTPLNTVTGRILSSVSGGDGGSVSGGDAGDPYVAITDENGNYVFYLAPGSYTATVTADGYIALTMDTLIVNDEEASVVPTITLLSESYDGETRIAGTLTNALDGTGVANATVQLRSNWNSYTAEPVATTTTDENGNYSIEVERGYYTATYIAEGFVTKSQNVVSVTNYTSYLQNEALTPDNIAADSYRIVLTWGETPRDLDSHITGPTADGTGWFHVYFGNTRYSVGEEDIVTLDHDDVTSWGPETVTIIAPQAGAVYRYSVHNFSNEAPLTQSGATVAIYAGNTLVNTYNVPVTGEGRIWNVFEIRDGVIVSLNNITNPTGGSSSDDYFSEDLFVE